jgi:hypothetical protein
MRANTGEDEPMKTNYKLALAVLAGASIGGAGAPFSHAYQIKTPPGYAFVEVGVTDPVSSYPCWCHAQEHAGERGKIARKTHHRHPAADIIRRPMWRSSRSDKVRGKAA